VAAATPPITDILESVHIEPLNSGACYGDWSANPSGPELTSLDPSTGEPLARIRQAGIDDY